MTPTLADVDLSGLSEAERLLLAGELLDMNYSKPMTLTDAEVAEMERRVAEADAGVAQG